MSKANKILDLVVTQHWFNLIKSGEKTHEYRVVNSWKRITQFDYKKVRFRCGQTTKATSKERCVHGVIKSITETDGKNTDLKINCPVFDIEFELIGDKNG